MTTATMLPPSMDRLVCEGHPLAIVEAPADLPSTALRRLRAHDLSAITLVDGPDLDTPAQIAKALLAALGKRNDVRGVLKSESSEIGLVATWLTAHQTRLVTVTAAQHMSAKALQTLADMVTPTSATLLLAVDNGYRDDLLGRSQHLAPVTTSWPEDIEAADADTASVPTSATTAPTWQLPVSVYWTFLADCRRQMLPEAYRQVHLLYLDAYLRVRDWLQQTQPVNAEISKAEACDCLHGLIVEQPRFEHVQVVTRAAQAAFHARGWYLGLDERALRHGLLRFPPNHLDASLFVALRGLKATSRAAETALYMAGATISDIAKVTIDDLSQWRHNPARCVAGIDVPHTASPYLRAHLIHRMPDGLSPHDAAFPAERRIANDINQAAADLGLNLGEANLISDKSAADRRVPHDTVVLERLFTHV
ncbi:hypothetical protein [Nocardioides ochotonae]|uniref:hypothetical protein n=1 Tax=Nocardioides ochotonae TaxID=2685869 RepID=UPI0014078946|nr:hypothetical protein [Nocardioides ochotonae]